MSDSVRRLRDKGRRRHTRKKAEKTAGAGAARDKARPALAPLHLLALLHNHARRPDSTTCDGFFSSPESSSRSASFDDFEFDAEADGGGGGVVDMEEQQLRDELASSASSLSSSSSSSSSTDSGEWSDWEDPLWVKDDNLLHPCDRDRHRISSAGVEPAAGHASGDTESATDSSSPQPARRPTKKTDKSKRTHRRKRRQQAVRPVSTAEQPTLSAGALTEAAPSSQPPGRVSVVCEGGNDDHDDDEERVWRKRIGVEALEAQTEELRLSVAEDPMAAAAAVVLELPLDSPFSSADEVAAISPPVSATTPPTSSTTSTATTAIGRQKPQEEEDEEWRKAVARNRRLMQSEAAFRLPERPSECSWRSASTDLASVSSAPMPATPCLADLGESLPAGQWSATPRPPREFAPAASDGALTLARRAMATAPTAESWATPRRESSVVALSSGGGSRLRDMQLIREMIDEQQRRVAAARKKRSAGDRRRQQAAAPATNPIFTSQEKTPLSAKTNKKKKTKDKKKKKKNENEEKERKRGSYEGKRKKLKRKTKLWHSLRRLKEKTAGDGGEVEVNGDAANNMADIGQVYVAAMATKGVRASAAAVPTRRTRKPATKNEDEEVASAKATKNETKEAAVKKKDRNSEADVGEVLSLSTASGHVMKVPVIDMTGLGSPAFPTTTSTTSTTTTTTWLMSSASMSAVPLSPGPTYDAPSHPTSPAGVAHRPRNVSDPTGGASSTLSESLSPRRRMWQAMTTPVVAATGNRFRRNSRRFDHGPLAAGSSPAADPLEWVASPLLDLLRQRQQQPPPPARRQTRDYRSRSLHLPESPVMPAAHLDHLADGERTLQSTA